MKSNQTMWVLVSIVVFATASVSVTTLRSQNQEMQSSQTQENLNQVKQDRRLKDKKEYEEQFPIVDYDEPEFANQEERQKRKERSKRFDSKHLVAKNPSPGYVGSDIVDEMPLPQAIPVAESNTVIIGEVLDAKAHLSNNKLGIYSEFTVRVDEILKNNETRKITQGSLIIADREGGFVRYSNGQKLLYTISGKGLPRAGKRVVLFLTRPDESSNYYILVGYELKESKVYPIDGSLRFRKFEGTNETDFIATVRNSLALPKKIEN